MKYILQNLHSKKKRSLNFNIFNFNFFNKYIHSSLTLTLQVDFTDLFNLV